MSRSAGMQRTRAALLDAAAACVVRDGARATTMAAIAAAAGVAKATLYNHFRTKDDVLTALVQDRVAALAAECARVGKTAGLAAALGHAGAALASSAALRRVAADEPARLVPLAVPTDAPTWASVRTAVADVLTAAGGRADAGHVEVALRWLVSQLLWPLDAADGAQLLVRGLLPASGAAERGRSSAKAQATGLGWPG